jgi:hypothetical protein
MRSLCSIDIESVRITFRNSYLRLISSQTKIGLWIFISYWLRSETRIKALELKCKQLPKCLYEKPFGQSKGWSHLTSWATCREKNPLWNLAETLRKTQVYHSASPNFIHAALLRVHSNSESTNGKARDSAQSIAGRRVSDHDSQMIMRHLISATYLNKYRCADGGIQCATGHIYSDCIIALRSMQRSVQQQIILAGPLRPLEMKLNQSHVWEMQ